MVNKRFSNQPIFYSYCIRLLATTSFRSKHASNESGKLTWFGTRKRRPKSDDR